MIVAVYVDCALQSPYWPCSNRLNIFKCWGVLVKTTLDNKAGTIVSVSRFKKTKKLFGSSTSTNLSLQP